MDTSVSASFTKMNVPPHTSEQNKSARSARMRLLKIVHRTFAQDLLDVTSVLRYGEMSNEECKQPSPARQDAATSRGGGSASVTINAAVREPLCPNPKPPSLSRLTPNSGIVETSLIGIPTHVATNSCDFLHLCHALDSARRANAGRQTRRMGRSSLPEFHHRQQCRRKTGAQDRNPIRTNSHHIPRWAGRRAGPSQSGDHYFRSQGREVAERIAPRLLDQGPHAPIGRIRLRLVSILCGGRSRSAGHESLCDHVPRVLPLADHALFPGTADLAERGARRFLRRIASERDRRDNGRRRSCSDRGTAAQQTHTARRAVPRGRYVSVLQRGKQSFRFLRGILGPHSLPDDWR